MLSSLTFLVLSAAFRFPFAFCLAPFITSCGVPSFLSRSLVRWRNYLQIGWCEWIHQYQSTISNTNLIPFKRENTTLKQSKAKTYLDMYLPPLVLECNLIRLLSFCHRAKVALFYLRSRSNQERMWRLYFWIFHWGVWYVTQPFFLYQMADPMRNSTLDQLEAFALLHCYYYCCFLLRSDLAYYYSQLKIDRNWLNPQVHFVR